ncbi:MAG: DUF371 domain-containing protein [Candidatus Bathyarchaeia archaeon]
MEAHGHPNITALHRTTLEITKEKKLTPKGTCIVAVGATKGAADLSPSFRELVRMGGFVTLRLKVDDMIFEVHGKGAKELELSHPTDIVCRKSSYICQRTLMIDADKAACDVPRRMVEMLKDPAKTIRIELEASI